MNAVLSLNLSKIMSYRGFRVLNVLDIDYQLYHVIFATLRDWMSTIVIVLFIMRANADFCYRNYCLLFNANPDIIFQSCDISRRCDWPILTSDTLSLAPLEPNKLTLYAVSCMPLCYISHLVLVVL